jgi:hypothetical protein
MTGLFYFHDAGIEHRGYGGKTSPMPRESSREGWSFREAKRVRFPLSSTKRNKGRSSVTGLFYFHHHEVLRRTEREGLGERLSQASGVTGRELSAAIGGWLILGLTMSANPLFVSIRMCITRGQIIPVLYIIMLMHGKTLMSVGDDNVDEKWD